MSDTTTTFADSLRELGVAGQVAEFDTDVPTAAAAAEQLGCELGAIENSLVFTVDDAPLLIIASGAHRVDTKRVARLPGRQHPAQRRRLDEREPRPRHHGTPKRLRTTKELIITVQAKGHTRLAEMNQRVATNLENIIDTIQAPDIAEAEDES